MAKENIRIVWDEASKEQWTGLLSLVDDSCYLHAWGYGEAVLKHTPMYVHRGIIYRSVVPIGIVQAIEKKSLFGALSHISVTRGPQWIENRASDDEKSRAIELMKRHFSRKMSSSFQIMPEMEDTAINQEMMKRLGFKLIQDGQSVSYLDLRKNLDHIKADFNKEWRAALKKAEQRDFTVTFGEDFKSLEWILEKYNQTKKNLKIVGPDVDFIRCFLANNEKPLFVAKIVVVEPYLAGALIVTHGRSATFLLGWSSAEGVEKNANHLLLWRSIDRLQKMGIDSLDLGGIDMKQGYTIQELKLSLNIEPKLLIGNYS